MNAPKHDKSDVDKKNNRTDYSRRFIVLAVAVVMVGILAYALTVRIRSVNNKIITGKFTLDNIKWYEQSADRAMNPAPDGERYITVVFGATNTKETAEWLTPVTQAHVIDANKNIHTMQLVESENPFQAGQMSPMEKRIGELSFLIPSAQTKSGFCFYVTADDGGCVLLDSANKIN